MQATLILGGAFLASLLLTAFPFIRSWWQAFFSSKIQALLIALLVYSLVIGAGSSVDVDPFAGGLPNANRLIRAIIFCIVFAISGIYILQHAQCWHRSGAAIKCMLIYALYAMASSLYSVGPFISLWKGFEVLTVVTATIALAGTLKSPNDIKQVLYSINFVSLYLVLTVFVGLALYPDQAIRNNDPNDVHLNFFAVRGLVPVINSASQGALAALLLISSLSIMLTRENMINKDRLGLLIIIIITITLILTAHSRTQIIAACITTLLLLYYSKRYMLGFILAILGSISILATSNIVLKYMYRGQTEEQFRGMTGRAAHWENVLDELSDSTFIGKGFYATQRILFGSGSVDNTYLECFAGLGLLGLIVLVIPILITLFTLYSTRPRSHSFSELNTLWLTFAGIYSILILRSFTSPTFASIHVLLLYYLIAMLAIHTLSRFMQIKIPAQDQQESLLSPESQTIDNNSGIIYASKPTSRILKSTSDQSK